MQKRAYCETNVSQELFFPSLCYNYRSDGKKTAFFGLEMTCRHPRLKLPIIARVEQEVDEEEEERCVGVM